jgi:hypothetical protein
MTRAPGRLGGLGRTSWSEDDAAAAMSQFEGLVSLYRVRGESIEDTHCRLQALARGGWHEGTGPDAGQGR